MRHPPNSVPSEIAVLRADLHPGRHCVGVGEVQVGEPASLTDEIA